jgi:plastocyanin
VARRFWLCSLAALVSLALPCSPAVAANFDVGTSGLTFSPDAVTITAGDTVTWTNTSGGFHNVHFDDGLFDMPPDPIMGMWSVYRTFGQAGTYTYYCEAHVDAGMTGSVAVNAAPAGGGGSGGGGGAGGGTPGPPPPIVDEAPVSSLVGPSKQDVDKLFVRASMNEAGTLSALASVSVPGGASKLYRFKRTTKTVAPDQTVKLRLKLAKRSLRAVKRALRRGRKLRARVTVTATDAAGHETVRKQKIRLTR